VLITTRARLEGDERERFVRIYEGSFPESERDDSGSLLASIEAGERVCHVALDGEALVGLAVILPLQGPPVRYLEYLAVDAERRSQGIGGRIIGHLRERTRAEAAEGIVFEVEPAENAAGTERALRERRIAMYRRHGATVVGCAPRYRAPDLAEEGTLPFTLMWLPAGGTAELRGTLLRECVTAILTQSYELAGDDPLLAEVVADLTC
jgi:ribosomal protein S18 acetylase RimI-like enzyme